MTASDRPLAWTGLRGIRSSRLTVPTVTAVGLAALVASVAAAVTIGAVDLSVDDVWRTVAAHLGLGVSPLAPLQDGIVWELRLPRVLTAAAVGAGLALSGAVMQAVTRNPLADPYLLGLSSGASLGAVAVLLLGVGLLLPVAAFGGALAALLAALALARAAEAEWGEAVPTTSVRVGHVPGTHTLLFDAPFEQVRLTHEARDRRVFAEGALVAARWLAARERPGVYTMQDVLAPGAGGSG